MTSNRLLGHILLWCGFFAAAFTSVCQSENAANKWASIDWRFYGAALAVGFAGVVVLRRTKRTAAEESASTATHWQTIVACSQKFDEQMTRLFQGRATIHVYDVRHFIDQHLATPLADFANARQTIADKYGLTMYARVMTEFASGERALNRAWAASADGYIDEVWLTLEAARDRFTALQALVQECGK